MGRLERERIERIIAGEEESIASQRMNLSGFNQKLVSKVEKITGKVVEKTLVPSWLKMDLPKQVNVARKMMRTSGMINFRAGFLKDDGFPGDVADMIKKGDTPEQIRSYYWDCPEWVDFWHLLELNQDHFASILDDAVQKNK